VARKYPGSVTERLTRKVQLLKQFREEGVPSATRVPCSLIELAEWEDESLDVHPLGSPNDVSTKSPKFGELAKQALDLLKAIQSVSETAAKKRRPTLSEQNASLRHELAQAEAREKALLSQFHMKDAALQEAIRDINSKDEEIYKLNEQNRRLTGRIYELESVRVVHVTTSDPKQPRRKPANESGDPT
jgi:hypothetical protein